MPEESFSQFVESPDGKESFSDFVSGGAPTGPEIAAKAREAGKQALIDQPDANLRNKWLDTGDMTTGKFMGQEAQGIEDVGKGAANFFLNILNPLKGENSIVNAGRQMIEEGKQAYDSFGKGKYAEAASHAMAVNPLESMIEQPLKTAFIDKDPGRALGQLAGMAVLPKVSEKGAGIAGGAMEKIPPAASLMVDKAGKFILPAKMLGAEDSFTRAIRPTNNTTWKGIPEAALPELKLAETESGVKVKVDPSRPASTFDQVLDLVSKAKINLWNKEYAPRLAAAGEANVNGYVIADAIEGTISKIVRQESPEVAARIMAQAKSWRRQIPIGEAEEMLHSINQQEATFYAKNKVSMRQALGEPGTAADIAKGDALRNEIYGRLDSLTGPGAREIKARYGALATVEKELYRRRNVVARQAPESLAEQLSFWHGVGKVAKGGIKILSGDIGGGAGDISGAVAGRVASKYLREMNSADALIEQAFHKATPKNSLAFKPPPRGAIPLPAVPESIYSKMATDNPAGPAGPYSEIRPDNPTGFAQLERQNPAETFRAKIRMDPNTGAPYEPGPGTSSREIIEAKIAEQRAKSAAASKAMQEKIQNMADEAKDKARVKQAELEVAKREAKDAAEKARQGILRGAGKTARAQRLAAEKRKQNNK